MSCVTIVLVIVATLSYYACTNIDWMVLRSDHLLCMDCFKKNKDVLKRTRSCQCGATFAESAVMTIL